jgi:hydroxymethylpyrimidine kinase/phosphomethylpyrimidine kinase/thiamine-phosphate diphosphorylase
MRGKIQGLPRLRRYCQLLTNIPIVAIGGINMSNLTEVLSQRPGMIAVVSAVTDADNPEAMCTELNRCATRSTPDASEDHRLI